MIQIFKIGNLRKLLLCSGLFLLAAGSGCGTNVNDDSLPLYPLEVVSVSSAGIPGDNGINTSDPLHISSDGGVVSFVSNSTNLSTSGTISYDVYVRNVISGTTDLVTMNSQNIGKHRSRKGLSTRR